MDILNADFGGKRARRRFTRWALLVAALLLFFWLLPGLLTLYTDWLWFNFDVRYPSVFTTILGTKIGLGVVFGLAFVLLVLLNAEIARRLARRTVWYHEETQLRQNLAEVMEYFASRYLYLALLVFTLVVGWGVGTAAAAQWDSYLQFRNAAPFGQLDPIFGRDVSFYVFRLPFLQYVWQWLYTALIAVFVISAAVHYLDKAIRMLRGVPSLAGHVKVHLSVLLALILAVKALGYRLDAYNLLFSTRGVVFGACYTDVNAQLLAYNVLFAVALLTALIVLVTVRTRGLWPPLAGIGFLAAVSLLLNVAYPAIVQRVQVEPAELSRESKYIAYNIAATRRAFGLDAMQSQQMLRADPVTLAQVNNNVSTVENVRLWDYRPLLTTYQQQQALATYYRFNSVDVDRYTIEGRYRQVMLAARELVVPEQARGWQNEHILYTHGYGIVMSPVTDAVGSGLPNYVIENLPPRSKVGLKVDRPGIYYGELTDNYAIVGASTEEIDYTVPQANKISRTRYSGKGGVPIGSSLARLAAAVRFGDINIVLSTLLTDKSRLLWGREITSRVRTIAPFLAFDPDPYIVLGDDGHLYWMLDAYTTSLKYPYAQPFPPDQDSKYFNYVRNSVKVVVEAYDGTVDFYLSDPEDPIAKTYGRAFPGIFKPRSAMPAGLQAHIRYPEGIFGAQCRMLTNYHVTDPQVLYTGSERWEEAREAAKSVGAVAPDGQTSGQSEGEAMQAYYAIVKLPKRADAEFLLMLPFTPRDRKNMVAWVAAQCDGDDYGKKLVYEYSKTEQVWGPMQVEAVINQNAEFSSLKTWLNQQGSSFTPGNLLVLPMDESVLYVEPYYLSATSAGIPELKYVVVTRGDGRVAFGPTLSDALTSLLGQAPPTSAAREPTQGKLNLPGASGGQPSPTPSAGAAPPPASTPPPAATNVKGLIQRANQEFKEAQGRQQKGDWAGYGAALQKLQGTLNQLMKQAK